MKKRIFALLLGAVTLLSSGCGITVAAEPPSASVAGHEIIIRKTLEKALDDGLALRDDKTGTEMTEYPEYGARQLWYQEYEITQKPEGTGDVMQRAAAQPSGVYIELCNTLRVNAKAPDCKISRIRWDLSDDNGQPITDQEILLCGIDFRGMTPSEVQEAMKKELKLHPSDNGTEQQQIYIDDIYQYTVDFENGVVGQVIAEWVIDTTDETDAADSTDETADTADQENAN